MPTTNREVARGGAAGRGSDRADRDDARRQPAGSAQTGRPAHGDLYAEVTRRIIGELEGGRVPWVRPWGTVAAPAAGLPRNAATGRVYSGINILILWGAAIDHGFPSQGWLTFAQALKAGGAVRKGERGTTVVYADRFTPKAGGKVDPGLPGGEGQSRDRRESGEELRTIAFLKRFTLFNTAQIDGLPECLAADLPPLPDGMVEPVAEAVIAASGVRFQIGGDEAFYAPGPDLVQVPPQPAFFDPINYYRTCLHELTHATGHASRLGRCLTGAFGSKDYACEELVAEMGAAFLCAALGIVPTVRHADYLAAWLEVLRADDRAIFRAASAASKAADWLLARHQACAAPGPDPLPPLSVEGG